MLPCQISQGGRQGDQRPRAITCLLRLPGRTRNCVSRNTFLGLAHKLIEEAQKSWRIIRGADKIELLLKGAPFKDGEPISKSATEQQKHAA
jgi:hypothetical protein